MIVVPRSLPQRAVTPEAARLGLGHAEDALVLPAVRSTIIIIIIIIIIIMTIITITITIT